MTTTEEDEFNWQRNLIKAKVFVDHVQKHLEPGQKVICKICSKNIDEIFEEYERRAFGGTMTFDLGGKLKGGIEDAG